MTAIGEKRKAIIIVWILLGLVFAFSVTGCVLSGKGSIYKFYNVGDVHEISDSIYNKYEQQENGHQEPSGKVILDNGQYTYKMEIIGRERNWKYFCLDLQDVHATHLQAVVKFLTVEYGVVSKQTDLICGLEEGTNLIEVPENHFAYISINIDGDPGDSYYVKKMQLRGTAPVFTWKAAIKIFMIAYAIYSMFVCILLYAWKKLGLKCRTYRWVEALQEFYLSVASRLYEMVCKIPWLLNKRRLFRTLLFALIFVYNAVVEMQGTYKAKFKYHLLFYSVALLLIAILSLKPKLQKRNWNNALAWSWFALWGMVCISDFLVPKKFGFYGYAMILVVGFFFFVWNNIEHPHEIVEDFVRAIHIFFAFLVVLCFWLRPESTYYRYSGFSKNPSIFAIYLGMIWVVALGEAEQKLRDQKSLLRMLPYVLEGCMVMSLVVKSWSEGPMLYMAIIAFVWFLRAICHSKKGKPRRKVILAVVFFILLLLPTYVAMDWGLHHISPMIEHSDTSETEEPVARAKWGMVAHASDLQGKLENVASIGERLVHNGVAGVLSERDYYYREYLREMNLFGHEKKPEMWGIRRLPHNAFLGIAYRYGVFAVVPYIMMLGAVLVRTFRYGKKKVKYAGMPFLLCLMSILMSMTDNVEQPFVWLPWIALYLMMGIVFADESQNDQDIVF